MTILGKIHEATGNVVRRMDALIVGEGYTGICDWRKCR